MCMRVWRITRNLKTMCQVIRQRGNGVTVGKRMDGEEVLKMEALELKALEKRLRSRTVSSSKTPTQIKCIDCKDVGWIRRVNDEGYEYFIECVCSKIKKNERYIKNCGIAEAFRDLTFNDFILENKPTLIKIAKKAAMQYAKDFIEQEQGRNNGLALLGTVGSGKTHLAVATANHFLKKGIQVRYMEYQADVGALKRTRFDQEGYYKIITPFLNCRVLLLDDLFKGGVFKGELNNIELQIVYEIINHRYLKKKPVIITSEYTVEEMLALDEAIGSRIMEMCHGHIVVMSNVDNHRMMK